ncbi:MAG: BamA/TamA family outer membrane protein [Bacteroidales bacterium]|nr:BamA/TamA family outer membrane protein [Bacteroidales bacterium]
MRIGSVERNKLRHNVPDIPTVYDKYVEWNIIKPDEANGGIDTYLRLGGGIDTRDNEAFATQGIWSEVLLAAAPEFLSSDKNNWGRLTVYHRQYFNLHAHRTVLAYRLGWQQKIWGDIPFYLLPHWNTGVLGAATSQGIGGSKTMRGIVRNRLVGDGSVMANIEFRHIFYTFMLGRQNFSIGTNLFADMGMVTQHYKVDKSLVPTDEYATYFTKDSETLHTSTGIGLKIAMNSNFVLSVDWGKATNKNDGTSGFYVLMNYLF